MAAPSNSQQGLDGHMDDVVMFGEEEALQSGKFIHPAAVIFHFLFRSLAIVAYLLCTWFSDSFITNFIVVVALLSFDFWTVKNITGRLLVSLRWWNYVDDEGQSHWVYEKRQGKGRINAHEARLFWIGLVIFPVLWVMFILTALFTLNLKWLLVSATGVTLSGANLYGYIRCKFGTAAGISTVAKEFLGQQVLRGMLSSLTGKPAQAEAAAEGTSNTGGMAQTV